MSKLVELLQVVAIKFLPVPVILYQTLLPCVAHPDVLVGTSGVDPIVETKPLL